MAPGRVRPRTLGHGTGAGKQTIAQTLQFDQAHHYEALKVLGSRTRRSDQEILLAALDVYLGSTGEG